MYQRAEHKTILKYVYRRTTVPIEHEKKIVHGPTIQAKGDPIPGMRIPGISIDNPYIYFTSRATFWFPAIWPNFAIRRRCGLTNDTGSLVPCSTVRYGTVLCELCSNVPYVGTVRRYHAYFDILWSSVCSSSIIILYGQ
jgi:hypothetical protein